MYKLFLFIFITTSFTFKENPKVILETNKTNKGKLTEVVLKVTIEKGWHIYSQFTPDNGPIPTTILFNKNNRIELVGKTIEPTPIKKYDENFGTDVWYFENEVVFKQAIKKKGTKKITLTGKLTYMVCNNTTCLPPTDINFSIEI